LPSFFLVDTAALISEVAKTKANLLKIDQEVKKADKNAKNDRFFPVMSVCASL
jgi:hypothetical protein